MKKFIFSIMALAGLLATSCVQEEPKVTLDSAAAVTPTIAEIPGGVLTKTSEDIVIDFGQADYGFSCTVTYQLYASTTEDFANAEKLSASYSTEEGTATITAKALNSVILNLGGIVDEEIKIYFRLSAYMATDKGTAVSSSETLSNVVSGTFVPYNMLVTDKDTYQYIYVQGNYASWDFAKCQMLYNYNKDGVTYSGIVDLGDEAANGIKFTDAGDWDHGNWGSEAQAEEPEASSVQLISGGASANVICYSKRFYMFTLNSGSLLLTKQYGFDEVGVVGIDNDWNTDVIMDYNADYVRFYADITVTQDCAVKFRADRDWDINWGADAVSGGDNIPLEAGNYRAYLDLNKGEITFDATMFGRQEPTADDDSEEEVASYEGWSLCGTLNGDNWSADIDMTEESENVWVVRNVAVTASDEFKIRENHLWNTSFGGPDANSQSTIDADNAYDVYKPTLGQAFATGGYNIQVGAETSVNVTYDINAGTVLVEEYVPVYSLIGIIEGTSWDKDFFMTQNGDVWTSEALNISGEFKIRCDTSWDNDKTYGIDSDTTVTVGQTFTAIQPGANITVPEGTYVVTFNPSTMAVTIEAK